MKEQTKRNIKLLGILNLFMDLKFYGAFAIIYFTTLSGSMVLGMSIFSIAMITNAIFEIPTGIISDVIGRKKTLILGTIFSLIYSICFAISNNYILLVVAAIFEGIERAFYSGNNEALLYDTLLEDGLEKEYKTYLGKTQSMYQLAAIIAVILGGVLYYFTSIKFLMLLTIIPKIINMFVCFKIKDPKILSNKISTNPFKNTKDLFRHIKKNSQLKKIIIADTIASCVGESAYQFRPMFYKMVWPMWAIGIPSLLSNIGMFSSNWFAGKIIKKFGDKNVLVLGNLYSIFSNIIGFVLNSVISPLILVSNSLFPTGVAKNSLLNEYYSNELRASMASFSSLIVTISIAIVMILVGAMADYIGVIKTLIVVCSFKIITVLIYNNVFKNKIKEIK
ncbi:MAG: MFS transporter [Bacilli bacterium]|nr:MFS transporter [Bacilli bacterium]